MRDHGLCNALRSQCLGLPIMELILKIKIVISCGIGGGGGGGGGEGMLRDKLVLVVVSCSWLGLTLRGRVGCGMLWRIRGGCGKGELVLLFVGCPVVIVLCLGRDLLLRIVEGGRSANHIVKRRGGLSG